MSKTSYSTFYNASWTSCPQSSFSTFIGPKWPMLSKQERRLMPHAYGSYDHQYSAAGLFQVLQDAPLKLGESSLRDKQCASNSFAMHLRRVFFGNIKSATWKPGRNLKSAFQSYRGTVQMLRWGWPRLCEWPCSRWNYSWRRIQIFEWSSLWGTPVQWFFLAWRSTVLVEPTAETVASKNLKYSVVQLWEIWDYSRSFRDGTQGGSSKLFMMTLLGIQSGTQKLFMTSLAPKCLRRPWSGSRSTPRARGTALILPQNGKPSYVMGKFRWSIIIAKNICPRFPSHGHDLPRIQEDVQHWVVRI